MLYALLHTFLTQLIEGDEVYIVSPIDIYT